MLQIQTIFLNSKPCQDYSIAKVWKQQTLPAFVVTTYRYASWFSKGGKKWSAIKLYFGYHWSALLPFTLECEKCPFQMNFIHCVVSEHDGIEFWSQVLFNYVHKKGFMLRIWRLGLPNAHWVEIYSEGLFFIPIHSCVFTTYFYNFKENMYFKWIFIEKRRIKSEIFHQKGFHPIILVHEAPHYAGGKCNELS